MRKVEPMTSSSASDHAVDALLWMAGRPDVFGAFMNAAGLDPADVRRRRADPDFLGFALDFLLADEALLLEFAKDAAVPPDALLRARALLPGGDAPHWT